MYLDKTQHTNFRSNPLYQATKRPLNSENRRKMRWRANPRICFWLRYDHWTELNQKKRLDRAQPKKDWTELNQKRTGQSSTEKRLDTAQPKRNWTELNQKKINGLALHLIFHRFSPFNCCLSAVL